MVPLAARSPALAVFGAGPLPGLLRRLPHVALMAEADLLRLDDGSVHMVILEERTPSGWAGAALVACPSCGGPIPLRVISTGSGRAVGLWLDRGLHAEHVERVAPT